MINLIEHKFDKRILGDGFVIVCFYTISTLTPESKLHKNVWEQVSAIHLLEVIVATVWICQKYISVSKSWKCQIQNYFHFNTWANKKPGTLWNFQIEF